MVAAADASNYARKLGIQRDQLVQELGWDEDTDDDIRADIEDACGSELLDEDSDDVVDVVLLWWRDDDGDLVDALMDAITPLAEDGVIWVLTPKTGKNPAMCNPRRSPSRRRRRVWCRHRLSTWGIERDAAGAAQIIPGRAAMSARAKSRRSR